MIFNSFEYAFFLPAVFLLYWFAFGRNIKLQNIFLLGVSYLFYAWWDWRFLSLIIFSSLSDFLLARMIEKSNEPRIRKIYLIISLGANLGLLGFFKYFNFFVDSLADSVQFFGFNWSLSTLNIILPVGISFYTFQTLSYTIDVYRSKIKASDDIIAFSSYVAFFPQLVAGPIERASNLLPQFKVARSFNYRDGVKGLKLIMWGLFKKMVIADNLALIVNQIFDSYHEISGLGLILGTVLFAFQIYGDFSGYSDIAIGSAKLLGFDLMTNFRMPYFSRDVGEFWRRWHISLSTWFRDYLYIPLGGSRSGMNMAIKNTVIIFVVSGLWHGANWTFVVWGLLNAIYFIPLLLQKKNRQHLDVVAADGFFPSFRELWHMFNTFLLIAFSWIFFRSESINDAFEYIASIWNNLFKPFELGLFKPSTLALLLLFVSLEWVFRKREYPWDSIAVARPIRWMLYLFVSVVIVLFSAKEKVDFIYFQF